MKDLIPILVIIFFILGPLIKKILEALAGVEQNQPQKKKGSTQEVKAYLEKMRTSSQTQGQYKAPATRPSASRSYEKARTQTPEQKRHVAKKEETLVLSVEKIEEKKSMPTLTSAEKAAKPNLVTQLMTNPRFSDVQKLIICSEILKRPKSLDKSRC